uniref:ZW10 interacting kinetochore protein n=1 Tax=Canis lupus familiaris TaxID=9615 RepID=A0A8I3PRQ4_CANLF
MDSRKKDKLLCSQLQVVDFLQNFLAQEGIVQGLDPLASEDTSRQKALAVKEQWKELKATYQEHVEAITGALTQALAKTEEAQSKRVQLQEALEQLQAKKQVAMERARTAQKQWQLQQEKRLQHLAEASAEVRQRQRGAQQELERLRQELGALQQQAGQKRDRLQRHQTFLRLLHILQGEPLLPGAETERPQELGIPEAKPREQNTGDAVGKDRSVPSQVSERWAGAGTGMKKAGDRPYCPPPPPTHTTFPFPRPMACSLPEGQAHVGFLRDSNMGKERRAGFQGP